MNQDRRAHSIAGELCRLTDEILFKPRQDWITERMPKHYYKSRIGRGKRTCLAYDTRGNLTITYGSKMVSCKFDAESGPHWTTGKEISRFGLFGGEINPLNLLAHTAIHEFGHLVQVVLGRRYSGSVHNREFYDIILNAHQAGTADAVRNRLRDYMEANGISPEYDEVSVQHEPLRHRQSVGAALCGQAPDGLRVGARILVTTGKQSITGTVKRLNAKSITIVDDLGSKWRAARGCNFQILK